MKTPEDIAQTARDNGYIPTFLTELCKLIMCSDPWPADGENEKIVKSKADIMAKRLGFSDWVEAYHGLTS